MPLHLVTREATKHPSASYPNQDSFPFKVDIRDRQFIGQGHIDVALGHRITGIKNLQLS